MQVGVAEAAIAHAAAAKLGVRKIVIASSETTYGVCFAEGNKDFSSFPLEEDYDTDPMDSYGLSKVVNEKTARAFAMRYGIDIYALRIANVIEPHEYDIGQIPNSKLIPLGQVLTRMNEIDPERETVVHCKMGGRSAKAIDALQRSGFTGKLANLAGGITAWSNDVDPSVPKY